jgi:hypothetical protein
VTVLIAVWILSLSMPQTLSQAATPAPKPDLLEQIACAPTGVPVPPVGALVVLGGYVHGRIMFGPGDAMIVSAGTSHGVQKGQQYFVRRPVHDSSSKQPKVGALYGVHTAGWVTIVDAKDTMAVATVTHACDGILEGDYLEPFVAPVLPSSALTGAPDYEHPGRILLADERRQTGYPGLVMLMNRGSDDGVRGGQMVSIYRETLNGQGPIIDVARGTVLSASPQSSLVRIDSSREAVYLGDLVAIHRITQ